MSKALTREQVESEFNDMVGSGTPNGKRILAIILAHDAALRARITALEGALKAIAGKGCTMPWGMVCTKTSGGELYCEQCLAQAALETAP